MMKTTARVTVTLELTLNDTWGPDCSLAQVHKQSIDAAKSIIRDHLGRYSSSTKIIEMKPVALIVPTKEEDNDSYN